MVCMIINLLYSCLCSRHERIQEEYTVGIELSILTSARDWGQC